MRILLLLAWLSLSAASYTQSLIAYYPFNGNANDESGNGLHGTVNAALLATDRFSNPGRAYEFTGAGNIVVGNNVLLNPGTITLSAWVYIAPGTAANIDMDIVSKDGEVSGRQYLLTRSSVNKFRAHAGTAHGLFYQDGPTTTMTNRWYHVVQTYNGTQLKLFVNGVAEYNFPLAASTLVSGSEPLRIGGGAPTGQNQLFFKGKIDDIRIYNGALSDAQVQALYVSESPVMPDLAAHLPLNGNGEDVSGNGYYGVVYGAVLTTDRHGNTNMAYSFSGDVGIALSNSASLHFSGTPFTVSAWVRYSSVTSNSVIIGKHFCGTPNGYLLTVENNIPKFWLSNSTSGWEVVSAGAAYNDNKWHQVTGVFTGTQQLIYVDGELKSSRNAVFDNPNTGSQVLIGNTSGSCGSGWFSGSIDEVRIYGAALSAGQVTALYKQSRGSGKAVRFSGGSNNRIDLGSGEVPSSFTVETWVKQQYADLRGTYQWLVAGKDNGMLGIGFYNDNNGYNRLFISKLGEAGHTSDPVNTADDRWHHVAVTYNAATQLAAFYFDGISKGSATIALSGLAAGNYSLFNREGTNQSFNGEVDEFRFWQLARPVNAIRFWMTKKSTPLTASADLIMHFNFDEVRTNSVRDLKYGAQGQLAGDVSFVSSGAPLGDTGPVDFDPADGLSADAVYSSEHFRVTYNGSGTLEGLSVYVVRDPPEISAGVPGIGPLDHYFGVYLSGGNNAAYSAVYDYTGNPLVSTYNEHTLVLCKRTDNSSPVWVNANAVQDMTANTLTVSGQQTEYILGSAGVGLPVTWLYVEAIPLTGSLAEIRWGTVTETQNIGFTVERSFDGVVFTSAGFVAGAGDSEQERHYRITDFPGRGGRVFYRIRQEDRDGRIRYSAVVSVWLGEYSTIRLFPNPASDLVFAEPAAQISCLELINAAGQIILLHRHDGSNRARLSLQGLPAGRYWIRVHYTGHMDTQALLIVR